MTACAVAGAPTGRRSSEGARAALMPRSPLTSTVRRPYPLARRRSSSRSRRSPGCRWSARRSRGRATALRGIGGRVRRTRGPIRRCCRRRGSRRRTGSRQRMQRDVWRRVRLVRPRWFPSRLRCASLLWVHAGGVYPYRPPACVASELPRRPARRRRPPEPSADRPAGKRCSPAGQGRTRPLRGRRRWKSRRRRSSPWRWRCSPARQSRSGSS